MSRHKVINLRLSVEEWHRIKAAAEKAGLPVGTFIRMITIKNC